MTPRYVIATSFMSDLTVLNQRKLIEFVGSAERLFTLSAEELREIGLKETFLANFMWRRDELLKKADVELQLIERKGWHAYSIEDDNYPYRMKECIDPPVVFYATNKVVIPTNRCYIGIVGTRRADEVGKDRVRQLVRYIASVAPNAVIVSGLASGIDTVAHVEALRSGLSTIAVFGTPLSRIYPYENLELAEEIIRSQGAIISEYNSFASYNNQHFVYRNRLIAALSDVVVVAQSMLRGGSMTTAKYAFDYNRDVLTFAPREGNVLDEGCGALLECNVAHVLEHPSDVECYLKYRY